MRPEDLARSGKSPYNRRCPTDRALSARRTYSYDPSRRDRGEAMTMKRGTLMKTDIIHSVVINGISVDACYSQRTVSGLFLPMLRGFTQMQEEKGRRILVMLAAPPGAGKSTLLSFLERLAGEHDGISPVQIIGIDGFHRRQEYLQCHYVEKDGKQIAMVEIKGAPITFDLPRLRERIRQVATGVNCRWPVYDRMLHNPVEDALEITGSIVLLEGNYLLLQEDGWRDLAQYADYTVSVRAEETMLRERLIERRIKTGVEEKAAVRFVDFSDMPNVRLCLQKSAPADLELILDPDGEYQLSTGTIPAAAFDSSKNPVSSSQNRPGSEKGHHDSDACRD